jgi:hypothetical protein
VGWWPCGPRPRPKDLVSVGLRLKPGRHEVCNESFFFKKIISEILSGTFLFLRKNESYSKSGLKLNLTVIMQRVLRLARAKLSDAPAGLPSRCLRFYRVGRSASEFIKKITHPYPFHFLLPCHSALRLPRPGRGRKLPSLLPHAPSAVARSRPDARASLPLPSRVLVLAPPIVHFTCPGDQSVVLVAVVLARTVGGGC